MSIEKGTRFRSVVADASVLYEVTRKLGRGSWEARVVNEPHTVDGETFDSDFAGRVDAFTPERINQALAMQRLAEESRRMNDAFYDTAVIGAVVHYDNGFDSFVRCEVAFGLVQGIVRDDSPRKCLKPVALVGRWRDYDLPKMRRDGTVARPYHADAIAKGRLFRPHVSCIYESPSYSKRGRGLDPRELPALDLSGQEVT